MRKLLLLVLLCVPLAFGDVVTSGISVQSAGVTSQQAIFVNQDPDPAQPGGYVDIRFKLENVGTESAKKVVFELLPQFPFSLDPGEPAALRLGTLDAGQVGENAYILRYRVRVDSSAVQGNNEIYARYSGDNGMTYVTVGPFQVKVRSGNPILAIESVSSDPETAAPGNAVAVTLGLHNLGESSFRNVKLSLLLVKVLQTATSVSYEELPFSPVGSTNEKYVLRIDPGELASVPFSLVVNPDATSGIYKVPVRVSYSDELGGNFTISNYFSLKVGEKPDVTVSLDSSTIKSLGSKGTVSVKFVNKGGMDLKFVSVYLKKTSDFDLLSSDSVYLGNIDSDDYSTADFEIYLKKGARETTVLPVVVEYRDTNNQKSSESHNLDLKTYSKEEAELLGFKQGNNTAGILLMVGIVVVGLIGYLAWRRRKRR